jgi:hypothetical protein
LVLGTVTETPEVGAVVVTFGFVGDSGVAPEAGGIEIGGMEIGGRVVIGGSVTATGGVVIATGAVVTALGGFPVVVTGVITGDGVLSFGVGILFSPSLSELSAWRQHQAPCVGSDGGARR